MKRERRPFRERATVNPTEPLAIEPSAFFAFFFGCLAAPNERRGPVTIVNVEGPLEQRASWFDGYDAIVGRFREALADESETVLLRIDSPGGACAGLFEAVATMRELAASSSKRVIAYADEGAYSAAYALACAAGEVFLPASGGVGSVGVITALVDRTARNRKEGFRVEVVHAGARKADGHPDVELSEEALARTQARVDGLAALFHELVSSARPLSTGEVAALEAGCFYGEEAVEVGLADGVMGLAALLEELGATDTEQEHEGGTPGEGDADMNRKTQRTTASSSNAAAATEPTDVLAAPIVQGADGRPLVVGASSSSSMFATLPAASEEKGEGEEEDKDEEESEDKGEEKESESTEDKGEMDEDCEEEESEDKGSEDEEAEEKDSEEGDDKESEEDPQEEGEKSAAASRAPTAATTRDVLALVRKLTGEGSPGAQIGALRAMSDRLARAKKLEAANAKLERANRKASVERTVDSAIKAGKLTPAQRAWAVSTGLDAPKVLEGYLRNATPVVEPARVVSGKKERAPKGAEASSPANAAGLTKEELEVARALHIDPNALAAHKAANGAKSTRVH